MITIQGKGVSAGVGVGPLYYYRRATAEIKRYTVEDTDAEWHRFKGAQTGAVEQLGQLAEQARADVYVIWRSGRHVDGVHAMFPSCFHRPMRAVRAR